MIVAAGLQRYVTRVCRAGSENEYELFSSVPEMDKVHKKGRSSF